MEKELITKFLNQKVAIGVPNNTRMEPYFFYGKILKINKNNILLELDRKTGYKEIPIEEIVDIHLDRKYNGNGRHNFDF